MGAPFDWPSTAPRNVHAAARHTPCWQPDRGFVAFVLYFLVSSIARLCESDSSLLGSLSPPRAGLGMQAFRRARTRDTERETKRSKAWLESESIRISQNYEF